MESDIDSSLFCPYPASLLWCGITSDILGKRAKDQCLSCMKGEKEGQNEDWSC